MLEVGALRYQTGTLAGPKSSSVFFQERGLKSFENSTIKLSAKETKWTV